MGRNRKTISDWLEEESPDDASQQQQDDEHEQWEAEHDFEDLQ